MANIPNSQIIVFFSIWVKSHYLRFFENYNLHQTFIFYKNTIYSNVCVVLHNLLREHQSSDEIFSEYESDDMVIDKNDEQSGHGNKVMCFIYFTIY